MLGFHIEEINTTFLLLVSLMYESNTTDVVLDSEVCDINTTDVVLDSLMQNTDIWYQMSVFVGRNRGRVKSP